MSLIGFFVFLKEISAILTPWTMKFGHKDYCDTKSEKKSIFDDKDNIKLVQKEVKREIEKGKREYKNKIEEKFDTNDMKSVWKGMNMMNGRTKSASHVTSDNDNYADELNTFYARFDCHDFRPVYVNRLDSV